MDYPSLAMNCADPAICEGVSWSPQESHSGDFQHRHHCEETQNDKCRASSEPVGEGGVRAVGGRGFREYDRRIEHASEQPASMGCVVDKPEADDADEGGKQNSGDQAASGLLRDQAAVQRFEHQQESQPTHQSARCAH